MPPKPLPTEIRSGPPETAMQTVAEQLVGALEAAFIQKDDDVFYRTANDIPQDVPERIARKVRLALDRARADPDPLARLVMHLDSLLLDNNLTDEKLRYWSEEQGPRWVDEARCSLPCNEPEALLTEAGQARRKEGEKVRDGE